MNLDTPHDAHVSAADALIASYLDMRGQLLRFLTARLGDPAQAEDIYQDMYARLLSVDHSRPIENVSAFLFRIAANLALDVRRGKTRSEKRDGQWLDAVTQNVGGEAVAEAAEPEVAIDAKRRLDAVVKATEALPPKCREAFVLHKFQGLTHAEVAARMGVSRKMVEKHISTALRVMVQALQDFAPGRVG